MSEENQANIDTRNDQMIGVCRDKLVVLDPKLQMTKPEALRHAAWLVALAEEQEAARRAFWIERLPTAYSLLATAYCLLILPGRALGERPWDAASRSAGRTPAGCFGMKAEL